jgi:type IV secretion system protein VirB5
MVTFRTRRHWILALVLFAGTPAAHAQWAVIDVNAIAQLVQQVQVLQQSLSTAQSELQQAQQSYQALTGDRGMERLLSGTVRNDLPSDWSQVSAVLGSTSASYGALAAQVQQATAANAVLSATDLAALSRVEQRELAAARASAALLQTLTRQALTTTSSRFASLQQLIDTIGSASDGKAILDLQARIGAEQTMLANDQSKLEALYQTAQAEEWARNQRLREEALADLGSMRRLGPMGL